MISPFYWNPWLYTFLKKLMYAKDFHKINRRIAKEIGNLEVLDLCCGECYITRYINKEKYIGWDMHKIFINYAKSIGINAEVKNVLKEDFKKSECVLMQCALYHFCPDHEIMIKKMLEAATKKVIIAEPIKNLSSSNNKIISFIAKRISDSPRAKGANKRLTEQELTNVLEKYGFKRIDIIGREMIAILEK